MMKKILIICLLLAIISTVEAQKHYAFVTDLEHDKSLDEEGKNGYVAITTDIVSFDCNAGPATIENQFLQYYQGEEKTDIRSRATIATLSAWVYDTYDEAVASRRDWLAKSSWEHKRKIVNFYVTCD